MIDQFFIGLNQLVCCCGNLFVRIEPPDSEADAAPRFRFTSADRANHVARLRVDA